MGLFEGILTTPTRVVQGVVGLKGVSGGTAGLLESVGIMGAVGPSLCTDKVNACNAARRMYAHLLLGAAHVKA